MSPWYYRRRYRSSALSTIGLLALVYVFAKACGRDTTQSAAPASTRRAEPSSTAPPTPTKLDVLPARAGDLTLVKAGFTDLAEIFVRGTYSWHREGSVSVVEGFKTEPDAVVSCDTSATHEINGDPVCGSGPPRSKKMTINGRKLCFDPGEKKAPKGLRAQGAYISWTDIGDCSIEFRHGLVSTAADRTAALATVEPIALWMDQFVEPNSSPAPEKLAANRDLMRDAIRAGRSRR